MSNLTATVGKTRRGGLRTGVCLPRIRVQDPDASTQASRATCPPPHRPRHTVRLVKYSDWSQDICTWALYCKTRLLASETTMLPATRPRSIPSRSLPRINTLSRTTRPAFIPGLSTRVVSCRPNTLRGTSSTFVANVGLSQSRGFASTAGAFTLTCLRAATPHVE